MAFFGSAAAMNDMYPAARNAFGSRPTSAAPLSAKSSDLRTKPGDKCPLLPADPRWAPLIAQKNVADDTRRGYAGMG
jgi:hypothetical protein